MSEGMPVCALCGEPPNFSRLWKTARCESVGCGMKGVELSEADWRRLMTHPRLAPEHVEALRYAARLLEIEWYEGVAKTIRAALAALGERLPT